MSKKNNSENTEILLYQTNDGKTKIEVRLENETVWLTQKQMAELFQTTSQNITIHIRNIYQEGELQSDATCKVYLHVQNEGSHTVHCCIQPSNCYSYNFF